MSVITEPTPRSRRLSIGFENKPVEDISIVGNIQLATSVDFGEDECMIVKLSHDKTLWAVGLASGKIKFYTTTDAATLAYTCEIPAQNSSQPVTGLVFVPIDVTNNKTEKKHLVLASYASGYVRLWHYTGVANRLLWTMPEPKIQAAKALAVKEGELNQILCLACSPDGQRFVTGGEDCAIRVYDFNQRTLINTCQSSSTHNKVDGHTMRVCAILYHPLGKQFPADYGHVFLSGSWDDTIQMWDDRKQHCLWIYFGPHVCGSDAIDIDIIQNHILTGSWKRDKAFLQVWAFNEDAMRGRIDYESKQVQEAMVRAKPLGEMHHDGLTSPSMGYVAMWLGDQYMLFGGSNANVLKIVDRGTLNVVGSITDIPKGVFSVASLVPDGPAESKKPYRLAVCAGNKLYVLKFDRK